MTTQSRRKMKKMFFFVCFFKEGLKKTKRNVSLAECEQAAQLKTVRMSPHDAHSPPPLASERTGRWRWSLPRSRQQMESRSATERKTLSPCQSHPTPPGAIRVYLDLFAFSLATFWGSLQVCHSIHTRSKQHSVCLSTCPSLLLGRGSGVGTLAPSYTEQLLIILCHQSSHQPGRLIFQTPDISLGMENIAYTSPRLS